MMRKTSGLSEDAPMMGASQEQKLSCPCVLYFFLTGAIALSIYLYYDKTSYLRGKQHTIVKILIFGRSAILKH